MVNGKGKQTLLECKKVWAYNPQQRNYRTQALLGQSKFIYNNSYGIANLFESNITEQNLSTFSDNKPQIIHSNWDAISTQLQNDQKVNIKQFASNLQVIAANIDALFGEIINDS